MLNPPSQSHSSRTKSSPETSSTTAAEEPWELSTDLMPELGTVAEVTSAASAPIRTLLFLSQFILLFCLVCEFFGVIEECSEITGTRRMRHGQSGVKVSAFQTAWCGHVRLDATGATRVTRHRGVQARSYVLSLEFIDGIIVIFKYFSTDPELKDEDLRY